MAAGLPIYLDHHATTPCDERVIEAMAPTWRAQFGNAASRQHAFGWQAEALVDAARDHVAGLIGARPTEIIFTSGATESDNLAIKGAARRLRSKGNHIITSALEHKAVLDTCARLEAEGFDVTYLEPLTGGTSAEAGTGAGTAEPDGIGVGAGAEAGAAEPDGIGVNAGAAEPDPIGPGAGAAQAALAGQVAEAIRPETILVSIMFANNEIGTVNPIAEIGAVCRSRGVIFHCDAVQALAWLPCDVDAMQIDLLSVSAHKMYGPKGVGALYVRRRGPRVGLVPLIDGGGHERGMRSGTLNVPGIVGLGKACEIVGEQREADAERIGRLRDRLRDALLGAIPDAVVNGVNMVAGAGQGRQAGASAQASLPGLPVLPNNLNISFPGIESDALMVRMKDVAVSSGSACTSATQEPSHVLRALGLAPEVVEGSIRFGLGRGTTEAEIDIAAERTIAGVRALREASARVSS